MPKKKDWIEIVLHLAFWVGVFYTLSSLTDSRIQMRIDQNGMILRKDMKHTLSPYLFLTLGFLALLFYGNIFWVFKKALRYKNIWGRIALAAGWFLVIFFANSYLVDVALKPITSIPGVPSFNFNQQDAKFHLKSGNVIQTRATVFTGNGLSHLQLTILLVFLGVLGLSIAYFFLKEWARAEKIRSQLEAVHLSTEIKFLKSQINPHFLFNTLNNLFSMAQKEGNDDLAEGISNLSGLMRYMIYESNAERVPLKNEIEYLEDCIVLNKLRYAANEAIVRFDYPRNTDNIFITPMLFIPFVENAFKHGVAIGLTSHIDISLSINNNELIFTCVNTDHTHVRKMDENSGVGLDNVKRRLELVYPGKHTLKIVNTDGLYRVELTIDVQ